MSFETASRGFQKKMGLKQTHFQGNYLTQAPQHPYNTLRGGLLPPHLIAKRTQGVLKSALNAEQTFE